MAKNKRRESPGPAGFLVVDKPVGWTSHDAVAAARRWLGTRRIGHLGALDPLATGVLPLAIRAATKLAQYVPGDQKVYSGGIQLGAATDTYDGEGAITYKHQGALPEEAAVRAALQSFAGEIMQVPPMYSAVKKDGVPLYKRARRGEQVEREARPATIHRIEMRHYAPPEVGVEIACTPGTYVRTLAQDLGQKLGCGAHLANLRRTQSGPFTLAQARTPEACAALAEAGELQQHLLPPAPLLGLPRVSLSPVQARRVQSGAALPAAEARGEFESGPALRPGARIAALLPGGELLALMELRPDRRLHPLRILAGAGAGAAGA